MDLGGDVMNKFSSKEVRRSIRDFESAANDVITSGYYTYETRIKTLNQIIHNNRVIRHIVSPFLGLEVNLDEINGDWSRSFKLPPDMDYQLAYLLKMFDGISNNQIDLEGITHSIYKGKRIFDNVQRWIENVCIPGFRELSFRLNDLIEDEVEGKEEVESSSLSIINYGSITATDGGNVALGQNINQTINQEDIFNEIMEKVKSDPSYKEKITEIESLTKQLLSEVKRHDTPDETFRELAKRVYEIGKKGLLKVFHEVISDPRWGQAVTTILLTV